MPSSSSEVSALAFARAASPASSAGTTRAAAPRTRASASRSNTATCCISSWGTTPAACSAASVPTASTATEASTSWIISAIRGWNRALNVSMSARFSALAAYSARSAASTARRTRGSLSLRDQPRYLRYTSERKKSGCERIHSPMLCMHCARTFASTSRNLCVKILVNASAIMRSAPRMRVCVSESDSASARVIAALGRFLRDSASSWRCFVSRVSAFALAIATSELTSCSPARVAATRTVRAREPEKSATASETASNKELAPRDVEDAFALWSVFLESPRLFFLLAPRSAFSASTSAFSSPNTNSASVSLLSLNSVSQNSA